MKALHWYDDNVDQSCPPTYETGFLNSNIMSNVKTLGCLKKWLLELNQVYSEGSVLAKVKLIETSF